MLQQVIEAEIEAFLGAHAELEDAHGRRRVVRNGHAPEREIQTGIGLMKQKLMTAMVERNAGKPKMSGRVELDDAYWAACAATGNAGAGRPARHRSWPWSKRASIASRSA